MDMPLDSSAAAAQTCQAHAYQLKQKQRVQLTQALRPQTNRQYRPGGCFSPQDRFQQWQGTSTVPAAALATLLDVPRLDMFSFSCSFCPLGVQAAHTPHMQL